MPSRLEAISERDHGRCLWCGRRPWPEDRSVEHICPRSRGGAGEMGNLALACSRCNRQRGSRSASAYARSRAEQGLDPDFGWLEVLLRVMLASDRRAIREYAETELRHLPAASRHGTANPC